MVLPDVPNWIAALAAIIGAPVGGYIGVKVAIMEIKTQMINVIRRLDDHDDWMKAHDTQYAKDIRDFAVMRDRAGLAGKRE